MVSLQIWITGKTTFLGMLRGGREEERDGRGRWERRGVGERKGGRCQRGNGDVKEGSADIFQ